MGNILNLAQHAIDETPEPEHLANNTEAEVRIVSMKNDTDKRGVEYIMPFFDVPSEPNIDEFSDYIPLPDDYCDEKELLKRRRKLQSFGECFDIDWSVDVDLDSLIGSRGFVIVGVRTSDEYGTQNSVRQYVSGK